MSGGTLKKLAALADEGALIVGERPLGPIGRDVDTDEFSQMVNRLWQCERLRAAGVKRGACRRGRQPAQLLQVSGVPADLVQRFRAAELDTSTS